MLVMSVDIVWSRLCLHTLPLWLKRVGSVSILPIVRGDMSVRDGLSHTSKVTHHSSG